MSTDEDVHVHAAAFASDGHETGFSLPKMATGIPGFDDVSMGGLPRRRATVLAGPAGSAKTVFSAQFLAAGVELGEPGVFVTLEEPAQDLRDNLATLGFDVPAWEARGDWRFVDASPVLQRSDDGAVNVGPYRMDALIAQIGHAVDATAAQRVVLDSLNGALRLNPDPMSARTQLRALLTALRRMGVTVMLTVETAGDADGNLSPYGIEEFVADNVVLLHHRTDGRVRRRTLEIVKMRGAMHHTGEVSFTVLPGQGILVLPMIRMHPGGSTPQRRVSMGPAGLDAMLHGGLLSGSTAIVAGPTGTGKTLLTTQFLAAGLDAGEPALLFAFEESREQVLVNARGWGQDFEAHEVAGRLHISALYPDAAALDDHLVEMESLVRRLRPRRVAIDSLSALERLGSPNSFREFSARLALTLRQAGVTTFMTITGPGLHEGGSVTSSHLSALADAIMLLRFVESDGDVRRVVAVLKVRGTSHDTAIREFEVTDEGMVVGEVMRGVSGLLSGRAGISSDA